MARGRACSLVLLTKDPPDRESIEVDSAIRWHQVADWIQPFALCVPTAVSFLEFLRERAMAIEKVDKDLIKGSHDLAKLGLMLRETLHSIGMSGTGLSGSKNEYGASGEGRA